MVSIILPTFNESDNILELINALLQILGSQAEIIVVDDNSPDETWRLVRDFGNPQVRLIRRLTERGLASAIDTGLKESKGEIVGWMDADMSMPPMLLTKMLEYLKSYDIAIGSRYVKGGKDRRGWFRVFTSRVINIFSGILLGWEIKDYDSGLILLKKEVLETITFPSQGYGDYFIEFIYKCKKYGFKIKEIPYEFTDRKMGVSKTASGWISFFRLGLGYIMRILSLRFSRSL